MLAIATTAAMLLAASSFRDAKAASVAEQEPAFKPADLYFGQQLKFVEDLSPFKTACTSRRAGKTEGIAGRRVRTALAKPGGVGLYITLSRKNAKRIVWRTLKNLNASLRLGAVVNESDLSLTFPNTSQIYLCGAKDRGAIEDFRGLPLAGVDIDEAQSMPVYIEELVSDVLEPGLMDFDGDLSLTGTPAPVPVGYFYEATKNPEWSHHEWTFFDNPWIERKSGKSHQAHLERALKRRGVAVEDPGIQREFFGRWVYDPNALVFRYEPSKNHLAVRPGGEWQTVIGVDLGFDDADAIAVLGFAEGRPEAHLREEHVMAKQTITELAERLGKLIVKHQPLAVVMDTGGLGKKIAEEIRKRFSLPIKAAEKTRKFEYIELLNDAMRTGRFYAPSGSQFARDCMLVEWDREKSKNDKLVVSDRYHSDICDAVLYAFRESLHWLHEPPAEQLVYGSPEWAKAEEQAMEDFALEQAKQEAMEAEWS